MPALHCTVPVGQKVLDKLAEAAQREQLAMDQYKQAEQRAQTAAKTCELQARQIKDLHAELARLTGELQEKEQTYGDVVSWATERCCCHLLGRVLGGWQLVGSLQVGVQTPMHGSIALLLPV